MNGARTKPTSIQCQICSGLVLHARASMHMLAACRLASRASCVETLLDGS